MRSVLITGSNRGIGLSLVKQFLALPDPPKKIIATCRNLEKAAELTQLSQSNPSLKMLVIDFKDFNKYNDLAKQVEEITQDDGLNVLINNAGISTKFTRIQMLKMDQLIENFVINTAGPIMLTKALIPSLKKAAGINSTLPLGVNRAAVVNISSVLGSISKNTDGGFYPYRCSKTALNAATKSLSLDLKADGIFTVAVHPGWCKTDMGGKNAPLETDTATAAIIQTLISLGPEKSGSFIQYDGQPLPH